MNYKKQKEGDDNPAIDMVAKEKVANLNKEEK